MQNLFLRTLCLGLVFCASAMTLSAQGQFRALLITQTAGWHHGSIVAVVPALEALAERHNFQLDRKQDAIPLSDRQLENYDIIILANTTGDIFTDEEQAAFEKFIQSGKGYVGIHAASDTEYEWPWYTQLVGHMFKIHPTIQTAMLDVIEPTFPGLSRWPSRVMWTDEWYEFGPAQADNLNYLITIDETTYRPEADWGRVSGTGMGDFHPLAWYHEHDGGRAFYTALGHMPEVYEDKLFLEHVYGGIYWAATGKGLKVK
jgi:uncharacterized protein